jgi:hypothetical protein
MASENCNVDLVNNTIVYNSTWGTGGGICTLYDGSSFTGVNNIIFFNSSGDNTQYGNEQGGGGSSLNYSCISQSMSGTGNITADPMFVSVTDNDYHLQSGSPCIDSGDPASPSDPDGTRADIGAFYYDQNTSVEEGLIPASFELFPVCPNPSVNEADFSCNLPQAGELKIIIFDITGREIITLCNSVTNAGLSNWIWDGRNFSGQKVKSGVYFCRSEFNNLTRTNRLVLIRD